MGVSIDAPGTIVFSIFYFVFSLGFVFQFKEFIGLGLTADNLLSFRDWVGSEEISFIQYNLRKTSGNLILYALLPLGYLLGYSYITTVIDENYSSMDDFWRNWPIIWNILVLTVLLNLALISLVWYWRITGWSSHPLVTRLQLYNPDNWSSLAADIDTEFRRIDKISLSVNPLERLVVTDNWVMLVGSWPSAFRISHQSDATLRVLTSENHTLSVEGELGGTQFLHLEVACRKAGVGNFRFRLNSLEYQNLQDKLAGRIENVRNVMIYKTVSERFVDVFKEQVSQNPRSEVTEDLEPCIGCMVNTANVKLNRVCDSSMGEIREDENRCVNCYCRPMWCVDCLGKWFASRQNQGEPETWMSSRCPCPTCRSKFCVLDVSLLL